MLIKMPPKMPIWGNNPFPPSISWGNTSWGAVIAHHVERHAKREDYRITFDDDDRLCVTAHNKKGYSVRVPLALASWTEAACEMHGIIPEPSYRDQARQRRGSGGSVLLTSEPPDRMEIVATLSERSGVATDAIARLLNRDPVNLDFDSGLPVGIRDLETGGIAFAVLFKDGGIWEAVHGVMRPSMQEGGREIFEHRAHGAVKRVRAGALKSLLDAKLEEYVEGEKDFARKMRESSPSL